MGIPLWLILALVSARPAVPDTYWWNRNSVISGDRDFNRSYNWTANADGSGAYIPSDDDDAFTDNSINSIWTWRDQDNDAGTGDRDVTTNADQLTLTARGADIWGAVNQFVTLYRDDIRGNFDVTVKVSSQSNTSSHAKAGIIVANDMTNLAGGGYCLVVTKPSGEAMIECDVSGNIGELETATQSGSGTFPVWLRLVKRGTSYSGYYKRAIGNAWTSLATYAPQGAMVGKQHVGLVMSSGSASVTGTAVLDDFQGGGRIVATGHDLSMNGTGGNSDADAVISSDATAASLTLTNYTGTLHFGGQQGLFATAYDNVDFTGTSSSWVDSSVNRDFTTGAPAAGLGTDSWSVRWEGHVTPQFSETYTFYTRCDDGTRLWVNNTLLVDFWSAHTVSEDSGSIVLTAGTPYPITLEYFDDAGSASCQLKWASASVTKEIIPRRVLKAGRLALTGNADMGTTATLTAGDGALEFSGTSGTQVFTPKGGATHPNITKTGASTLQLSTNDLTALSYTQTAGILDFNGRNITTANSGNFSITNGTTTTLTNLGGRTLTVAGSTSLDGQSGNLLNLNPSSAWTVASAGPLVARYAAIQNGTASVSVGVPIKSTNGGGNANWNFKSADYSAWSYSSKIAFNTTSTGADVSGNVNNFPLLVRLSANNFLFSQAKSDGADIRFQDPDGTALGYYVERWDAANKVAEVWVKVPQVDGNSSQDYIRMYWGNASAAAASSGFGVFSDYKGVWHLAESPGASAPQFTDASGNANHGTAQGGAAGDSVTAAIGKGYRLNGSSTYVTSATSFANPSIFTAGVWFRTVTRGGGKLIGFGAQTGSSGSYDRHIYMHNDGKLTFGVNPSPQKTVSSTASYNDGAWHHAVARLTSAGMTLYVDGAQVGTDASVTSAQNFTGYWRAGFDNLSGWSNAPTSAYFNGTLDHVTVAHASLSADFIKLSYQTQKPGSTVAVLANTGLSNWTYSTKVYINTTASGANITSTQSNYPLLVRLSNANFAFSQAMSDGRDLRFADSAGNLLAYEIERWNATSKLAEIWVLVPTVYGNNNSQWIRMYWGNGNAQSLSSGPAVFLGSAGYVGVYHLNEDGNTTSGGYKDASTAENHGTGIGFSANADVSGAVGVATSFAAASNQGVHVPHHASQSPTSALTIQAWVYPYSLSTYRRIAGKPFTTGTAPWNQYSLETTDPANKVYFSLNLGGAEDGLSSTSTLSVNNWCMVGGTYDGAAQKIFFNGAQEGSYSRTGTITNYSQVFAIGKYGHGSGNNFDGVIDEVRVSGVARSEDWMKLDYETMKSGSTVVTVGERSPDYSKSVQLLFNTTSSGANVPGNVTNIPILVRLSSANFDFSAARADAADIKFVDKDGTNLYHEVVEWDKANKVGKVWVKVPQVDGNSSADYVTAYYGCAACTGSPYAVKDSVWSGYRGAWHLAGGKETAEDVTRNPNDLAFNKNQAMAAGLTTALAPNFDGTADYAVVADPADGSLDVGTGDFTTGIWFKTTFAGTSNVWPVMLGKDPGTAPRYGYSLNFDTPPAQGTVKFETWSNGSNANRSSSQNTLNDGAWHHAVGKKTATQVELFIDGVSAGTYTHAQGTLDNAHAFSIGARPTGSFPFQGYLQEAWIAPTAFSADYIKLSYQNQKENSAFLSTPITAAAFTSSKVFKFNTTSSGANVSGDVYDFPLLIRLTDASIIDATQSAGQDIRFLDGDGVTWLDYQIERWDQTNNVAEVWVKVPKVDGNSTGDFITLYYNDAAGLTLPDGQCGSCVFGTSNGFAGVWHLQGGSFADATANANNGTNTNSSSATGIIAQARSFNGSTTNVSVPSSATLQPSRALTMEAWVNLAAKGANDMILSRAFTSSASPWVAYNLDIDASADKFGFELTTGGTYDVVYTTTSPATGTWYHLVGTYDGSNIRVYLNGALQATVAKTGTVNDYGRPLVMGAWEHGATDALNGILDEPRISLAARSADWIKLSYETQRADPTLFNPSTAEFVSSRKFVFNTTRTGANVMGDVSNFPLLVRITGSTIVDAVQNDYDDIRFLDGDGKTWLPYQVERWDKTNDVAEVWVLVPKVDGNSNTDHITLYYDDVTAAGVADGQCASCVFSTSNGFQGVWHLNNAFTDATSNANNGTNNGTTSATGMIGLGQEFNGTSQYITVANHASLNPTAALTLSAWAWSDSWSGANRRLLQKSAADNQYTLKDEGDQLEFFTGSVSDDLTRAALPSTGAWHHYVATYNGANRIIYVDGAVSGSEAATGAINTTTDALDIGRKPSAGEYFDGIIDEVRVASSARSADWVKLEYETQKSTGNLFWNSRPGPNNKATLTAADAGGSISLVWSSAVTDSSNADSLGVWVKYSGTLDSSGAAGQTKVALLPKTDSAYSYPATYPGTYYFGLAVRNSAGAWSPFTAASIDTVVFGGNPGMLDTVYADTAIGSDSYSCLQARSPVTPKRTLKSAWECETDNITDTLVVRAMPGTFTDSVLDANTKKVVIASFDRNSRAVLGGSGQMTVDGAARSFTVLAYNDVTLRNLDVRCAVNGYSGIYLAGQNGQRVDGVRVYNNGSLKHAIGIEMMGAGDYRHIANTLVHQPTQYGIYITSENSFNIVNNVLAGDGGAGTRAIYMNQTAGATDMTLSNNILLNWDYGIQTTSANIGVCSNNLFHRVTSGREVTGTTDANKVIKDPLFYSTEVADRHAFKLLPGSPAIDAGTTSYAGGAEAVAYRSPADMFGTSRPQGGAPDIGLYEGTGHTPNPSGEFDTLTNTVSGNTVIVKNSKWKLVWDMARGAGINGFYDMTGDTTANLLVSSSLLFDVKLGTYSASAQTGNTTKPVFLERTRTRSIVRQRLAVSASQELIVTYAVHASGHVHVQSEILNLSSSAIANLTVDYILKVSTATASSAVHPGTGSKNGFGYLLTSGRDAFLSVTQDLDAGAAGASETWSAALATGATGTLTFATTDLADIPRNMSRQHHFLLYVGDKSMDLGKASALNADAYSPSLISTSAGSLLHERGWQDALAGHWTLDDGAGTSAQDKSLANTNTATLTSATWVSGKVNGGLRFITSSVATVADHADLEADHYRTFMFWMKPDFAAMGTTAYVLSKGLTTSDGWYFRKVSGQNQIQFVVGSANVTSPTLATSTWHHVAGVIAGGTRILYLYVNGVLVGASTTGASPAANASNLLMGKSGADADAYAGDLDDVRVYKNVIPVGQIQSIYRRGFSEQYGTYNLRADNNNRVVALLNEDAAATRVQPAFQIDNWYGPRTPKYVYLNGARLTPNVDFVSDSTMYVDDYANARFGNKLLVQVNKVMTGASQTLFVDDDDSTGYLGASAKMKTLAITATANDKIAIQNFSGSTFGTATSGQWYLELDLNGWTTPAANPATLGFGRFNSWKAAAINPNLAVSSSTELAGLHSFGGRSIFQMKLDHTAATNRIYDGGMGYAGTANLTYTVADSSATRLSIALSNISLSGDGTLTLAKKYTVYPNGRIFASYVLSSITDAFNLDEPRIDFQGRYNGNQSIKAWASATGAAGARVGRMGGGLDYHSFVGAVLSIRSAGTSVVSAAGMVASSTDDIATGGSDDYSQVQLSLQSGLFQGTDDPVTVNFFMDISKDFTDSATADSLARDIQTPAAITALTGTATTNDALDFNADGFAEGDGAYTYTAAASGIAHFRFVNTVSHFNPAFRIKSWAFATLPEFVIVDQQTLVKDYHYNAYVNTATSELILQFNKTYHPGTHVFYISQKTGLAVTLSEFEAVGGEGVDTLKWTTQSEFENLGFNLYRRVVATDNLPETLDGVDLTPGAALANALREKARTQALAAAARLAKAAADTGSDTLPSLSLSPEELKSLGYVKLNAKLLPGAEGGSSAGTKKYQFIDRTAAYGTTYEYLLEAVDFNGARTQFGPRQARPENPLETALLPNYPNPFNPVTTLRFSLREAARVSLVVYDGRGRVVRTLLKPDKAMKAGKYRLQWDARDDSGFEVPSGQYFYRFTVPKYSKTRKMILVK